MFVWRCMGRNKNKEISAALFNKIEPLLPAFVPSAKGGRPRVSDEMALNGILFVLRTGIPWEELPQELGFGSGMTCWRRLRDWQAAGVWRELHLKRLNDCSRPASWTSVDSAWTGPACPVPGGGPYTGPPPRIGASSAASATSSRTPKASP